MRALFDRTCNEGCNETPADDAIVGTSKGNRFETSYLKRYRQQFVFTTIQCMLTRIEVEGEMVARCIKLCKI